MLESEKLCEDAEVDIFVAQFFDEAERRESKARQPQVSGGL